MSEKARANKRLQVSSQRYGNNYERIFRGKIMGQWDQVQAILQTLAGEVRGDRSPRQVLLSFSVGVNVLITLEPREFSTAGGKVPILHIDNTNG